MAGEQDHEVEQLTPEQNAQADAEFEAAFNKARGEEPSAEEPTPTPAPTAAPEPGEGNGNEHGTEAAAQAAAQAEADAAAKAQADAEAAAAQAQAEANAPVSITKAELDALRASVARVDQLQDELKRTQDSTAGRIGSLKQTIEAVKARAESGQRPTIKQMKRLEEEFPQLAEMLKADLEEAFGAGEAAAPEPAAAATENQPTAAPTPAPTAAPVDPFADPRVIETLRHKEMAVLDASHPDWRDLKAKPEFNEWRTSLPQAAQQLLASTWESKVLKDAFDDFKGWMKKRAEQAATTNQRNKRLEHGTPATTGAPTGNNAVDDDAAFLAGFKAARGT